MPAGLQHRTGEICVPLAVIKMSVQLPALEVILIIHKPVGHVILHDLKDAAVDLPPGQGNIKVLQESHLRTPVLANALVERENDLDLMPRRRKGRGQRASYVGQTAGLDERGNLRGGKENFHVSSILASIIHASID